MNLKVVLTCLPYFNHIYTPPIQLAYLKSYLEQDEDILVKTLDLEVFFYNSNAIFRNSMLYWENIYNRIHLCDDESKPILDLAANRIVSEKPDVIGFSVAHSNFHFTRYIAQQIKKIVPNAYIIYGGRYFCLREPSRFWVAEWHKSFPEVDCIIKNEGEATLMEILRVLKKNKKPAFCKGATVRSNNKIIDKGDRNLIENIDSIPFPDFSDFSKRDYLEDYIRILFSRGCAGRCVYCVENDTMGSFRNRSPNNILDEIRLRVANGYRKFQIVDLAINLCSSSILESCKLIIKEKLDIEFIFSEFRHSPWLTHNTFELLHKAGFSSVCFGTESGSQDILDKMGKGVKVETIDRNLKDAHSAGLKVILYLMVGFPGETEKTFLETIEMLKRNKDFISGITGVNSTEICAGSAIHDNIKHYDVDVQSLFKFPDIWKTKNGSNCIEWRKNLINRLYETIAELGIPMVDIVTNGNPAIPKPLIFSEKEQEYKKMISERAGIEKRKSLLMYAAELKILKIINGFLTGKGMIFLLEIFNIGESEWQRCESDWIRVGCKIYKEDLNDSALFMELRQELPSIIRNGEKFQAVFKISNDFLSKGKYKLKFDMVNELQFWFEDLGSKPVIEHIEV